jgi:hypothetical protein
MRTQSGLGLAAVILLLGMQTCQADYILSLSTTAPDLDNLAVGERISIGVNLSGIGGPADALDFLAATVKFDGNVLGSPTVTPGGIVPDLTGFQMTQRSGLADANYDSLFATTGRKIASNGVFFSFDVVTQRGGAGQFTFDFVNAMKGTNTVSIQGGPALSFRANAIPEPSSLLLLAMGLLGLVGCHWWNRGARRTSSAIRQGGQPDPSGTDAQAREDPRSLRLSR